MRKSKRRKQKGFRAVCISIVLALLLAACGHVAESNGSSEEENRSDAEQITLTVGVKSGGMPFGDGIHTEESRILQVIAEETGVIMDFVTYDSEKFDLLAAGGELPDILVIDDGNNIFHSLISSGQLLKLDELVAEYGENIRKNIQDLLEKYSADYGGLYFLPTTVRTLREYPVENGFVGLKIRYDIYKAIGSPEITSEEELLLVLKQMQDYQRAQTGDDSIYALSGTPELEGWAYRISYAFHFGLMNAANSFSFDMTTGEVYSNYLDENSAFWRGVEFYNKAYRMGIFDPDGFAQKTRQYDNKVKQGKVLTTMTNWSQPDAAICGEEAICVYAPGTAFPYLPGVYNTPYPYGYGSSNSRAISTNCKYPERAMELLNWLDSQEGMRTLVNGVRGETWDVIDGVPQLIGEMKESYSAGEYSAYRSSLKLMGSSNLHSGEVKTEDGYPVDLSETEAFLIEMATPAQKAFAQDFDLSFSYPGQVYDKWVKEGIVTSDTTEKGALIYGMFSAYSDGFQQREANALDAFVSNETKLIMSDSDEEFEKEKAAMIEQFKELGMEENWAETQALYKEACEKYEVLYGE